MGDLEKRLSRLEDARSGDGASRVRWPRWLLFCVRFVGDRLSWQTPGALSPDLEDLL